MTTYYVSQQRGGAGNNGTAAATPKATLAQVIALNPAAGDTIYIGPGTYVEALTPTTDGTSGSHITWQGDPDVRYVTGDTPGVVRVSRVSSGTPGSGKLQDMTGRAYHDFYDLYFDGSSDATPMNASANNTWTRCVFLASSNETILATGGTYYDCLLAGPYRAIECNTDTVTFYRCLIMGGQYGVHGGPGTTFYSCVGVSGNNAFAGGTAYNCTAIGGYYGYQNVITYNCLAMACRSGFAITGAGTFTSTNCAAVGCLYGYSQATGTFNTTSCYGTHCYNVTNGSVAGSPAAGKTIIPSYNWVSLFHMLDWADSQGIAGLGQSTAAALDFLGRAWPNVTGTYDIGHLALPSSTLSWTVGDYNTAGPAIKITNAGTEVLRIPVKSGQTATVAVQTKWDGTLTNKPSIQLVAPTIATQTATNTAATGTWQQLSVNTGVMPCDDVVELWLNGNDGDASASTSYFSDLAITVA
jgi:hypothetical protein